MLRSITYDDTHPPNGVSLAPVGDVQLMPTLEITRQYTCCEAKTAMLLSKHSNSASGVYHIPATVESFRESHGSIDVLRISARVSAAFAS